MLFSRSDPSHVIPLYLSSLLLTLNCSYVIAENHPKLAYLIDVASNINNVHLHGFTEIF